MNEYYPTKPAIADAARRIRPHIDPTPVFQYMALNEEVGTRVDCKMENMTDIGAFKIRGAIDAVLLLSDAECRNGVVTHSSGNHAQALAKAAQLRDMPAYIVMPSDATDIKRQRVLELGGQIIESAPSQAEREKMMRYVQRKTGAQIIHPYNDYNIICGQATAARELILQRRCKSEQFSTYNAIYAPVGGGGLLSGTALSAHYYSPRTKIIGAEPEGADDAYRSLQSGRLVKNVSADTIADGLRTNLGNKTFPLIQEHVDHIVLVTDDEIRAAMQLLRDKLRLIIEPSSAVAFAALFKEKAKYNPLGRVGVIVSGGNVDIHDGEL